MRIIRARAWIMATVLVSALFAGCLADLQERLNRERNRFAGPGELAGDFLKPAPYAKLLVEIDFVAGAEPNNGAVEILRQRLSESLGKDRIDIVKNGELPQRGSSHRYTLDDIADLEADHRDHHSAGDTAALWIAYLDGGYEADAGSSKVLGVAYRGASIAMFKGNIRDASRPDSSLIGTLPKEIVVERAVIVHEVGHILGLVNNGIPMVTPHEQVEDPEDSTPQNEGRHHSSNKRSVMFWAVESSFIGSIFDADDIPYDFDANDKADMRAVREG